MKTTLHTDWTVGDVCKAKKDVTQMSPGCHLNVTNFVRYN